MSPRVKMLGSMLRDNSSYVRHQAAVSLGRLGTEARIAVPALIDRIADDVWSPGFDSKDYSTGNTSKDAALSALRRLSPEKSEEALIRAAKAKNETVRVWAATQLAADPQTGK